MSTETQEQDSALSERGLKRLDHAMKHMMEGFAEDVLKGLERDTKRGRGEAKFYFEPDPEGNRDVLTVLARQSPFYRQADGGEYQYVFAGPMIDTGPVDRATAVKILATERKS